MVRTYTFSDAVAPSAFHPPFVNRRPRQHHGHDDGARAILDAVAAFAVYDPAAVQEMIAAGIVADVTLSLGGKRDMPPIGLAARTVSGVSD